MIKSNPLFVIITLVVVGAAVGSWVVPRLNQAEGVPEALRGVAYAEPQPVPAFTLTDADNQPFDRERLKNRWTFLVFGYTHCPDICPYTLGELNHVYERLEESNPERLADTQFVFVSVDYKRDTPATLHDYVRYFNEHFVGATGNKAQIDDTTRKLGVGYSVKQGPTADDIEVQHSASILLVGPRAQVRGAFSPPHDPAAITREYLAFRQLSQAAL